MSVDPLKAQTDSPLKAQTDSQTDSQAESLAESHVKPQAESAESGESAEPQAETSVPQKSSPSGDDKSSLDAKRPPRVKTQRELRRWTMSMEPYQLESDSRGGHERFFSDHFLLNRSRFNFTTLARSVFHNLSSTMIQLLIFGGGLWVVSTLSHLSPRADLAASLIPITLFAIPFALLSSNNGWRGKVSNTLFLLPFIASYLWGFYLYFNYPAWAYRALWIALEGLCLVALVSACVSDPLRHAQRSIKSLARLGWFTGLILSYGILAFIAYHIGNYRGINYTLSNLLSISTLIFFLVILVIRVFWLDGIKMRRAVRAEFFPPANHVLILDWIIPSYFNFVLFTCLVPISLATVFSTLYSQPKTPIEDELVPISRELKDVDLTPQVSPLSPLSIGPINERKRAREALASWESQLRPINPPRLIKPKRATEQTPLEALMEPQRPTKTEDQLIQKTLREVEIYTHVKLSSWVFFAFKPYVFPKDDAGREVLAPIWFKYLGRAILGLIIAILLTKQLNIWKQIMGYYSVLLGAKRQEEQCGAHPHLAQQQAEMIANLTGIFNHYAFIWRSLLYYAATAPTPQLRWRIILDPASAYYMSIERVQDWLSTRWEAAIGCVICLMIMIMGPVVYLDTSSLTVASSLLLPSFGCAAFILLLRRALDIRPPSAYQRWIWWSLLVHLVSTIAMFFIKISAPPHPQTILNVLSYTSLWSMLIYPLVYILSSERYQHLTQPDRRREVSERDCDVEARRMLLLAFCETEHRHWFIERLTRHVHPIRSASTLIWLFVPSLLYQAVVRTSQVTSFILRTLSPLFTHRYVALSAWGGMIIISAGLTGVIHLFTFHQILPRAQLLAYVIDVCILVSPLVLTGVTAATSRSPVVTQRLEARFVYIDERRLHLSVLAFTTLFAWLVWNMIGSWHILPRVDFQGARIHSAWLEWLLIPVIPLGELLDASMFKLSPRRREQLSWLIRRRGRDAEPNAESSDHSRGSESTSSTSDDHSNGASPDTRVNLFKSIETQIKRSLKAREDQIIKSIHEKAARRRIFDPHLQDTLIECIAHTAEVTFEQIRNGGWFLEERHAFSRVSREVVLRDERGLLHDEEVAEELGQLLESALDTLGSLLYDLCYREGFLNLSFDAKDETPSVYRIIEGAPVNVSAAPTLTKVIDALCRVATLPSPRLDSARENVELNQRGLKGLLMCQRDVLSLAQALLESDSNEDLRQPITQEIRVSLLCLWSSLEAQLIIEDDETAELSPALSMIASELRSPSEAQRDEQGELNEDEIRRLLYTAVDHPHALSLALTLSDDSAHINPTAHQLLNHMMMAILAPTPIASLYREFTVSERAIRDTQRSLDDLLATGAGTRHAMRRGEATQAHLVESPEALSEPLNAPESPLGATRGSSLPSAELLSDHQKTPTHSSDLSYWTHHHVNTRYTSVELISDDIKAPLSVLQAATCSKLPRHELLNTRRALKEAQRSQLRALQRLYFGVCAYLFATLKHEGVSRELDSLSWIDEQQIQESLKTLEQLSLEPDSLSDRARDVILALIQREDARLMSALSVERSPKIKERARAICMRLMSDLIERCERGVIPYFSWRLPDSDIPRAETESVLVLRGLRPSFLDSRSHEDSRRLVADAIPVGRGLKLPSVERLTSVDYYTAVWILKQLYRIAHSDQLFRVRSPLKQKAAELQRLLNRASAFIEVFPHEYQSVIESMFKLINSRLEVLRQIIESGLEVREDLETLDDLAPFRSLNEYLSTLESRHMSELSTLVWLHLPPTLEFSYLLQREPFADLDAEVSVYIGIDDSPYIG